MTYNVHFENCELLCVALMDSPPDINTRRAFH